MKLRHLWYAVIIVVLTYTLSMIKMAESASRSYGVQSNVPSVTNDRPAPQAVVVNTAIRAPVTVYKPSNFNETAVICAIVVNEERYLDEWIDYHLSLGFAHIFLYDNSHNYALANFTRSHVTTKHYPGYKRQELAYKDCHQEFVLHHYDYVLCSDVDEFLVLKKHDNVLDFIQDHLAPYGGSVMMNWYIFGTANETVYRPLPVTQRFVYRNDNIDRELKTISKASDVDTSLLPHIHYHRLKADLTQRNTNGIVIGRGKGCRQFHRNGPSDVAVIHHYQSKSVKEFIDKRKRGRADLVVSTKERRMQIESIKNGSYFVGKVFDDLAWQTLKRNVPWYVQYDAQVARTQL